MTQRDRSTDVLVVQGLGAVADQQHQHGGAEEEQHGKVQVVDAADHRRAGRGEKAATRTEPELWNHPTQAHRQASHQTPECTLVLRDKERESEQ